MSTPANTIETYANQEYKWGFVSVATTFKEKLGPSGLTCSTSWSTSPALSWYFDLKDNSGGIAAGQFVVVTDTSDNPCLVVFTDNLQGTWFLSAPGEAQGGCAE